jgi:acyl-CoA synthetase (AMP-forming)/AMP-acid ligase II
MQGGVGEIALKSPYMLKEYYKNPEMTAAAIDLVGWYHTGDLGFVHDENIYITGRKKDLLIIGGRNFYPQDIERVCDEFGECIPGRSVALGVMDERMGTEKAILLVESKLEVESAKVRLIGQIRKTVFDELDCPLADVRIVPHMWLLKTSSGKIARQPNLDKYQQLIASQGRSPVAVRDGLQPINWALMLAWSLVLGITIYLVPLLVGFGVNESWNIYMRF